MKLAHTPLAHSTSSISSSTNSRSSNAIPKGNIIYNSVVDFEEPPSTPSPRPIQPNHPEAEPKNVTSNPILANHSGDNKIALYRSKTTVDKKSYGSDVTPMRHGGFRGRPGIKTSKKSGTVYENSANKSKQVELQLDDRLLLNADGTSMSSDNVRSYTFSRSPTKVTARDISRGVTSLSPRVMTHGKHCDACAVEYVKNWFQSSRKNPYEREQLDHVENIITTLLEPRKVRSNPDVRCFHEPLQLLHGERGKKEKNKVLMVMDPCKLRDYRLLKEPAKVPTVSLPKKGLIKLTGLTYELENPEFYDDRRAMVKQREQQPYRAALYGSATPPRSSGASPGPLIRSRTMIKQLRRGERLMAELNTMKTKAQDDVTILDTYVSGLLHYEMPEVPHLNSNLQRFVGNDSQSTTPRVHREEITRSLDFPDPRNPPDHSLSPGPSSPRYPYNQLPSKDTRSDQSEGSSVTELMYSSTSANLHQMITNAKKLHSTYIRDKSKDSNLTLPTILN